MSLGGLRVVWFSWDDAASSSFIRTQCVKTIEDFAYLDTEELVEFAGGHFSEADASR